ncbi:unnamed protein product [Rotaria magnacalcarata]
MNTSANRKKPCAICSESAGILTCIGCQQAFCGKHVSEHRQKLAVELDHILQDHDLIQHRIKTISTNYSLLEQINRWEENCIERIKVAADTARENLGELLNQSKEKLTTTSYDLAVDLRSSLEADDYSENDIIRWTQKLSALELEIKTPSTIRIIENKRAIIRLINIESNESTNENLAIIQQQPILKKDLEKKIQGVFLDVLGPARLEHERYVARHVGVRNKDAYVRGNLLYHHGQRTIRVRIENFKSPYCIFFGCISSQSVLVQGLHLLPCSIGWFGYNQVYEHGRCSSNCKKHGYNSQLIKKNDVLRLTFHCDEQQIRLYNERLNTTSILNVDIKLTPYPWQLLMVMRHKDDCVKILSDQ